MLDRRAPWDPRSSANPRTFVEADPVDRRRGSRWRKHTAVSDRIEDVETVLKKLPATDPGARAILARIAHDRGDAATVESLAGERP